MGVVILGIALRGMGAVPSWSSLGGMSSAGLEAPSGEHLTAGELGAPVLGLAAKPKDDKGGKGNKHGKGDKHGKSEGQDDTTTKGKGQKKDKPNGNKHSQVKGTKGTEDGQRDKGNDKSKAPADLGTRNDPDVLSVVPAVAPRTFLAVADGRVEQARPTKTFATTDLQVDGEADAEVASYLRFDVSGLTTPVQRATLRLWVPARGESANAPAAYSIGTRWTESGLTWHTRPVPPAGNPLDDKAAIPADAWVEYDVTEVITGNGTYAFALLPDSSDEATFASREGVNPPQLVLATHSARDPAPDTPLKGGTKKGGSPTEPKRGARADRDVAADRGTDAAGAAPTMAAPGSGGDPRADAAPDAEADPDPTAHPGGATVDLGTTRDADRKLKRRADPGADAGADVVAEPAAPIGGAPPPRPLLAPPPRRRPQRTRGPPRSRRPPARRNVNV
jgi:hypothetical protein